MKVQKTIVIDYDLAQKVMKGKESLSRIVNNYLRYYFSDDNPNVESNENSND